MEQKIDLESSLKLLYDFLKLEKRTADFPCTLDVIFGVYCVWIKQDSAVQSPGTAELWPQQATFVLNFQELEKFEFSIQDDKLGLGIDCDGRIRSVMIDGQSQPLQQIQALLFNADSAWNGLLTRILEQFLIDHRQRLQVHAPALEPPFVSVLS
jgi:hypothetical protein